ncbi:MAG: hypothetical protein R3C49_07725 [Planctomycetaceae bacterium]
MTAAAAESSVVLDQLRRQLKVCQVANRSDQIQSSGFQALDRLLPDGGLPSGCVVEWISQSDGLRTASLALSCAKNLLRRPGALAVVDAAHEFHPVSLSHLGIPLSRLLLIRPSGIDLTESNRSAPPGAMKSQTSVLLKETLWSLEQLARCAGISVVLAWIDRLSVTAQRRLQLAVEHSGATVFLMRPATALAQTSWADFRFHVQSTPNTGSSAQQLDVRLVRARNCVLQNGRMVLDIHDETGAVSEISELADPAASAVSAG